MASGGGGTVGSVGGIRWTAAVARRWAEASFATRLAIVAVAAGAWRLVYVQLELPYRLLTDEAWYLNEAHQLFGAHPWTSIFTGQPTALHGPLPSILVAPVAWLFPHALAGLRNVMALYGVVTVVLAGLAGRELGGDRVGLLAAAATAVLPDFWIRDGLVVAEPVAALLVMATVWVALRTRRRPTLWWGLALGVLAGLLALTRPEIAPAVLLIAVVVLRGWRRERWVPTLVVGVAFVAVVSPWFAYNQGRFEDQVLFSTNLGITLAGANCGPTYYGSALLGYDSSVCWQDAMARWKRDEEAGTAGSDESAQSASMVHQAETYAVHHLDRVPLVVAMREVWFLGLYRPGLVVQLDTLEGQPSWATWSQAVSFWIVFTSAMAMWWRARRAPWPHWLLGVLVLNSFVTAGLFVGHWRYRITLDVAMVLLLALGIDRWLSHRGAAVPAPITGASAQASYGAAVSPGVDPRGLHRAHRGAPHHPGAAAR